MDKTKFKYETIGTTMVLEGEVDVKTHEEIHKRFAQSLAQSMQNTKDVLMGEILRGNISKRNYEIEVDFDKTND